MYANAEVNCLLNVMVDKRDNKRKNWKSK